MNSSYLKEQLTSLAALKERSEHVTSEECRAELRAAYNLKPGDEYAAMVGRVQGMISGAHWRIEAAIKSAERLEIIEREHERLVTIFEALEIDLDEEALVALEMIGKDSAYRDHKRDIRAAVSKAVNDTQWCERDYEHDQATEALVAAGFAINDEGECFTRGSERVTVTLVNGREARYAWTYESHDNGAHPLYKADSGKSGEFFRLMKLIALKQEPVPACGGTPSGEPCGPSITIHRDDGFIQAEVSGLNPSHGAVRASVTVAEAKS